MIEKNVPIPINLTEQIKKMEVGDSILFEEAETADSLNPTKFRVYCHRNGKKHKCKRDPNGGVRCWLVG